MSEYSFGRINEPQEVKVFRERLDECRELNAELLTKLKELVTTNPTSVWFAPLVEQARELIAKAEKLK